MKYVLLLLFFLTQALSALKAQEATIKDPDVIYKEAVSKYHSGNLKNSLELTRRGLELAPEYHDIRILQIRIYWALQSFESAHMHMEYLLEENPQYPGVRSLALQHINRFPSFSETLVFVEKLSRIYPNNRNISLKKAELLLQSGRKRDARKLAMQLFEKEKFSGEDRYRLQIILNRTVSDEIGIHYQYMNFSEEYPRSDSWNSISAEYLRYFRKTAVIGRATYSNRAYDDGALYELEAYPIINEKFYGFTNLGVSDGRIFPDVRTSASLFYNFTGVFEAEAGARVLIFGNSTYFTGIAGITAYVGKFYLNTRVFMGPERRSELDRNYQFNLRYYFGTSDNFLSLRLGNGISPDETILSSEISENPSLEVWHANLGINKTLGKHHILQAGAGFLTEDLTHLERGKRFIGTAGYRYRF